MRFEEDEEDEELQEKVRFVSLRKMIQTKIDILAADVKILSGQIADDERKLEGLEKELAQATKCLKNCE
jgi:hypothetical protein